MAQDKNKIKAERGQSTDRQEGRSGRQPGQAPRTTETGGQNSGGQTERVNDKGTRKRQGGGK